MYSANYKTGVIDNDEEDTFNNYYQLLQRKIQENDDKSHQRYEKENQKMQYKLEQYKEYILFLEEKYKSVVKNNAKCQKQIGQNTVDILALQEKIGILCDKVQFLEMKFDQTPSFQQIDGSRCNQNGNIGNSCVLSIVRSSCIPTNSIIADSSVRNDSSVGVTDSDSNSESDRVIADSSIKSSSIHTNESIKSDSIYTNSIISLNEISSSNCIFPTMQDNCIPSEPWPWTSLNIKNQFTNNFIKIFENNVVLYLKNNVSGNYNLKEERTIFAFYKKGKEYMLKIENDNLTVSRQLKFNEQHYAFIRYKAEENWFGLRINLDIMIGNIAHSSILVRFINMKAFVKLQQLFETEGF